MKRFLAISSIAVLTLAACGADDGPLAEPAPAPVDGVSVAGAWARTSPMSTSLGAVYFEVTTTADDTLLGVSLSEGVADHAEIHEMVAADLTGDAMSEESMDAMHDSMSEDEMSAMHEDMSEDEIDEMHDSMSEEEMSAMHDEMSEDMADDSTTTEMAMRMQQMTGGLPLPAGETVVLRPGSYHVMLIDLVEPLATGDTFEITLDFDQADDQTVVVEVAESAP